MRTDDGKFICNYKFSNGTFCKKLYNRREAATQCRMAHKLRNRDKSGKEGGPTPSGSQENPIEVSDYESLDEYGIESQPEEEHRDGHQRSIFP